MFGDRLRVAQFLEHPRMGFMRVKGCQRNCLLSFGLPQAEAGRGSVFAASLGSEEYRTGTPVPRKYLPAVKVTIGLVQESALDRCSVKRQRSLVLFFFGLKTVEFPLPFSHPTLRRHRCFILWLEALPHLSPLNFEICSIIPRIL